MAKRRSKKTLSSGENGMMELSQGHGRRKREGSLSGRPLPGGPKTLNDYLRFLSKIKHVFTAIEHDPKKTTRTNFKF